MEKYLIKILDNLNHAGCLLKDGRILYANNIFKTTVSEKALLEGMSSQTSKDYSYNFIVDNLFMTLKKINLDEIYDLIFFTRAKEYALIRDPLTNLLHRECLEGVTSEIIEKATLINKILAFMFLDLDGFKLVNDTYGHDSGDLVLQETARRITGTIRDNDICFRLGGDEFLVILTEIKDKLHSCLVARRLLSSISQPIPLDQSTNVTIGVSIGIAGYPDDGIGLEELMNKADEAMYKAKKLGKNNYQLY